MPRPKTTIASQQCNSSRLFLRTRMNFLEREFKAYAPGIGLIQDEKLLLIQHGFIEKKYVDSSIYRDVGQPRRCSAVSALASAYGLDEACRDSTDGLTPGNKPTLAVASTYRLCNAGRS